MLIVDDQSLVAQALESLFRSRFPGGAIELATDWGQATQAATRFGPELVLMDPWLPEEVRFRSVKAFATAHPVVRLMFLDDVFQPAVLRIAITLRATGYWTKRSSVEQVADALTAAGRGEWTACPEAADYFVRTRGRIRFRPPTNTAVLTRREVDVLGLLSRGLSVKECAQRLRRSPNTVDNHKSRLMKKLGLHRLSELILWAAREGLGPRE